MENDDIEGALCISDQLLTGLQNLREAASQPEVRARMTIEQV